MRSSARGKSEGKQSSAHACNGVKSTHRLTDSVKQNSLFRGTLEPTPMRWKCGQVRVAGLKASSRACTRPTLVSLHIHSQTDRRTDGQTDRQTDRQTDKLTYRDRGRQRQRQRQRQRDRQRQTETDRQSDSQTETRGVCVFVCARVRESTHKLHCICLFSKQYGKPYKSQRCPCLWSPHDLDFPNPQNHS